MMDEQRFQNLLTELKDLEKYHLQAQVKLEEKERIAEVLLKDLQVQGFDPNNLEAEAEKLELELETLEIEFNALKEQLEVKLKESNLWS